jgi:hypothetical protein
MDELGAALRRISKFLGRQRPDASAAVVSRLEMVTLLSAPELVDSHQARIACGDDRAVRWM